MLFNVKNKITKSDILNNISQEDIMSHYCGYTITTDGSKFICPTFIRAIDNNPSFVFYYNCNGRLRARDTAGDYSGDCFDVACKYHGLNSNNKNDFNTILKLIAADFKLTDFTVRQILDSQNHTPKPKVAFFIDFREFNNYDTIWWDLRFTAEELKNNRIYAVQNAWKNDDSIPFYVYSSYDPCYVYYIGRKDGVDEWQFYFPLRKKGTTKKARFIGNGSSLKGIIDVKESNIGIITKSYKDVAVLRRFKIEGKPIQAVACSSEGSPISEKEILYLSKKWNYIFINYDPDRTGKRGMMLARKQHGLYPITFVEPVSILGKQIIVKDFSELVKEVNNDLAIQKYIDDIYEQIKINYNIQ